MEDNNLYGNAKIYRIDCIDGHYYIGSTRNTLALRLLDHKKAARMHPDRQLYRHIIPLGWTNIKLNLIEEYPCKSKQELNTREDYHIQQAIAANDKLCLNINRAFVSSDELKEKQKEYREQNKERIDDYMAHYRLENAEKRQQYTREYVATNAETVKERKREYNAANREKIAEKCKQYAAEHKDQIQEYKNEWARNKRAQASEEKRLLREQKTAERVRRDREIIQCICGGTYQFYQRNRHLGNKKHVAFAATKTI